MLQVTSSVFTHGCVTLGDTVGSGSLVKCTAQVKDDTLNGGQDSAFAIIDGNGSSDAPHVLQTLLSSTLSEELQRSTDENELLYLEHTFLTLHR